MKFHARRIRLLRRLALAACLAAFMIPSSAVAMPADGVGRPAAATPVVVHQTERAGSNDGKTFTVVLASVALVLAFASLAWAATGATRAQGREAESH